jgi:HTH-type transcriptional regulator / antitoxin HigA
MTLTFDLASYTTLLTQYRPKIITTEAENDTAIALAEELAHRDPKSLEEEALLELLITLIEKFENEHYPIPVSTPLEMLKHLIEARNLKQEDLVGIIGSRGVVSEVINGKRDISKAQAKSLAHYFNVDVALFI